MALLYRLSLPSYTRMRPKLLMTETVHNPSPDSASGTLERAAGRAPAHCAIKQPGALIQLEKTRRFRM